MIESLASKFSASTLLRYQEKYIKLLESIIFGDFSEKKKEIHGETLDKISQGNHGDIFVSLLLTSIEMIAELDEMIQADKIEVNVHLKEDFPDAGFPPAHIQLPRKANITRSNAHNALARDFLITKYKDPVIGEMGNSMFIDSQCEITPAHIALLAEKMLYDVAMFRINEIRKKKGIQSQKIADKMEEELLGKKNE